MSYLILNNGLALAEEWIKEGTIFHARIRGERLTNCGEEFSLFQKVQEEEPKDSEKCSKCDRVNVMIQSAKPTED